MPQVIECVVNVSEGRRSDVLEAITTAITATGDTVLRHVSSDPSHNRTVFTMTGAAATLEAAVLALYGVAIERIDLRRHEGVHPRMGAVDVVPFIPLRDVTMAECVALARRVGARVARTFALPVYLYGEAASTPERRALERVRRGGFEGLADKLTRTGWHPDFGPPVPHPTAGASAVGARSILIAFNVNLDTDDIEVARAIAHTIRERDGGLPAVKALGLHLAESGTVQVSINLVDYTRTPLQTVFETVRTEAARRGVSVTESELVGLVPSAAIRATAQQALRLGTLTPSQILDVDDSPAPPGDAGPAAET